MEVRRHRFRLQDRGGIRLQMMVQRVPHRIAVGFLRQVEMGDLGQRMHNALCQSLKTCDAAVLVGTDCPSLTRTDIDTACRQLLAGTDVVLGPATDGGYYLVGLRQPHPELFTGISWGRGEVLAQTLARARQQVLQVYLLPRRDDLDTPADYRRFLGRDEASADIQGSA